MKTFAKPIFIFIAFFIFAGGLAAQSAEAVEKVSLTVSNLEKAVKFYTEVLGFQPEEERELSGAVAQQLFGLPDSNPTVRIAGLKLGGERIELMEFSGVPPGRPIPADSRSNDLWFQHIAIVVSDMDKAYARVQAAGVAHVSTAPQTLPEYLPNAAGISAFYFRDPDGHNLELIHFPKKKGKPWWQEKARPAGKGMERPLFLGIDHTAIGIEQTEEGYAFWREILKLKVAGHSENYGTEQEHLNQVFGARLYITGLIAHTGFGVEFLDYIAPPGGRPYPADSRPADLWHWHTTLKVKDLEKLSAQLSAEGYQLISQGIVQLDASTKALMVRDRDGHAVLLEEPETAAVSTRGG